MGKQPSKKKRRVYEDEFRASAVAALQAEGYPNTHGSLAKVAARLNVPAMTLSRWFHGKQNRPPKRLVTEKKEDLADAFESVAFKYLKHASDENVIKGASARDAVMNAAVAVDKMRLLRGLPTEIVELLPGTIEAAKKMNLDLAEIFRRLIERAANVSNHD